MSIRGTDVIWVFYPSGSLNDPRKQVKNREINWEDGTCNNGLNNEVCQLSTIYGPKGRYLVQDTLSG